ncbi:MAG: class I adenylate-forming enzyme family protein [Thermodesulfobacteriota bacterium]
MNLAENLERSVLYFPDRKAIIDEKRQTSYLEFNQESNRVATALISLGVQRGDHVALCAPNSCEWLAFYFGVLKAGGVAVTLPSTLTKSELARLLDDARPKIIFTVDEKLDQVGSRRERPYMKKIISAAGDLPYSKLLEMGSASFKAIDLDRKDTAAILYTGGTTGIAKGVMLTHENIKSSVHNVSHFERSNQKDCALCFLPPNHIFAQIHIIGSMIYAGGSLVIQPSFDLEKVLDAIGRYRVTKFYGVPTIYFRLLQIEALKEKLGSVNYCFSAAASMPAEIVREWKSRTQLKIHESYGMTETATMVTYNHYIRHVVGSVGTPVNIVEVQIRDPNGNVLGAKEEGEICIRGPNVMKGYLNNPEETRAVFWGDWLRSGDIGVFDEDGYLYIIDRIKDMIITGGENVYPREIEEILYRRPEVGECSVIGLPDKEYGERVTACIVLKGKDLRLDPMELKSFLKSQLAPFKVPKDFIVMDELPKGSTGKILKRELKKQVMDKLKP